jgi:hypothetical protein
MVCWLSLTVVLIFLLVVRVLVLTVVEEPELA